MNESYNCILLTNSHDELELKLIEEYGITPPRSGQFRGANSNMDSIKNTLIEKGKEWAIYEDADLSVIVVHFNEKYNSLFFAKRGRKIENVNQITDF